MWNWDDDNSNGALSANADTADFASLSVADAAAIRHHQRRRRRRSPHTNLRFEIILSGAQ